MNAQTKIDIVNPDKMPAGIEFTRELARQLKIQVQKTNRAGEYGFRLVSLADETNNKRLIDAATRFADDDALGVQGVRGERVGIGGDQIASAGGYTQTRLDALKRLREAKNEIGIINYEIVRQVAVLCWSARAIGRYWTKSDKTATAMSIAALEKLADWYESPRK